MNFQWRWSTSWHGQERTYELVDDVSIPSVVRLFAKIVENTTTGTCVALISHRNTAASFSDVNTAQAWCWALVSDHYVDVLPSVALDFIDEMVMGESLSLNPIVQPRRLASLDPVLDPEEGVERRRRVQVYVPVPHSSELEVDGVKPQQRYRVIPTTVRDIREGDQIFHNGELVMVRSVVMDRGKLVINFTSSSGHMGSRATMYGMTIDRIVDGMKPQERIEMKPVPVKNIRAQVQARYGSI